jgi:hypothetical protein
VAQRVDPPKNKFFSAMAGPKIGVVELSHPLHQSDQAWCHLKFSLLVIYKWRKLMPVLPLRGNMHID